MFQLFLLHIMFIDVVVLIAVLTGLYVFAA